MQGLHFSKGCITMSFSGLLHHFATCSSMGTLELVGCTSTRLLTNAFEDLGKRHPESKQQPRRATARRITAHKGGAMTTAPPKLKPARVTQQWACSCHTQESR